MKIGASKKHSLLKGIN